MSGSVEFPAPMLSVQDFGVGRAPRAGGVAAHPVAEVQKFGQQRDWELKKQTMGRMFGLHMPQRLMMERTLVGGHARLPGMLNSNLGMDILENRLTDLEWSDVYNDPANAEREVDWRGAMETKLGLTAQLPASTGAARAQFH